MKRARTIFAIACCVVAVVAVGTGAVGTSNDAVAQTKAPPRPVPVSKASFQVALIEASKTEKPFTDPKLGALGGHLRPFQGKYNRFVLVTKKVLTLPSGGRGAVAIPGRGDFAITFLGVSAGKVGRVRYQVELPKRGTKMTRSVAPGGQTLDVIPSGGKVTIVSTTVMR